MPSSGLRCGTLSHASLPPKDVSLGIALVVSVGGGFRKWFQTNPSTLLGTELTYPKDTIDDDFPIPVWWDMDSFPWRLFFARWFLLTKRKGVVFFVAMSFSACVPGYQLHMYQLECCWGKTQARFAECEQHQPQGGSFSGWLRALTWGC